MKKTLILCVVLLTLSACTRIKNKVESVITNCAITECHIGSLYSDLKGKDCDGTKIDDGIFYNYCFRYKAIPAEVENALMAKTCFYVEIVPDSVLVSCDKEYILNNIQLPSEETYPEYVEWRWCEHPDSLEFYKCTRTPLQHLLVFDKVTGQVYHFINEFRE